ncbi:hypothetical protein SLA2020_416580 [Shorea laevis]
MDSRSNSVEGINDSLRILGEGELVIVSPIKVLVYPSPRIGWAIGQANGLLLGPLALVFLFRPTGSLVDEPYGPFEYINPHPVLKVTKKFEVQINSYFRGNF